MEELLILLLEFFGQMLLEVLLSSGWDLGLSALTTPAAGPASAWTRGVFSLVVGLLLGGLSVLIFPRVVLIYPWLRGLNLVFAPVAAAGAAWWLAGVRPARAAGSSRGLRAALAGAFAFGLVVVRFTGCSRG